MEATTTGLTVRGLVARLGERTVLDGVDLDVAPGEVLVLQGPSGAGKSTLLRCLVRLVEPAGGVVALDAIDVSQAPVMLPGTVADNLRYANAGLTGAALEGALTQAGLAAAFADRPAAALSGGERARVALARALARGPEVLLLDEPSAALDATTAQHIAATIRSLARAGLGICVATHDPALVTAVADRRMALG